MNAFASIRAARIALAIGIVLRALVWGAAAALTVLAGAAIADVAAPLSLDVRSRVLGVAMLAAAATIVALIWRDRTVWSASRVALWIEEHFPSLDYALVTAVEAHDERFVAGLSTTQWPSAARRRALRVLGAPAIGLVVGVIVLLVLPAGAVARVRSPRPGDSLAREPLSRRGRTNRLSPIVAEVTPPSYSGRAPSTIDEPADVRALSGSRVTFRGRGDPTGIVAIGGTDTLSATAAGDEWSLSLTVGGRPLALRFHAGDNERIVAVEPIADAPPIVTLTAPAKDSVLRGASGRIPLTANATDDVGLAIGAFEYIVSSGEGETFKFRSGTIGASRLSGASASLSSSIRLDSLKLQPGDILHLRAVARDGNVVTGPGVGASETRTIRIARQSEYDSVAVDAAAPSDAEKGAISERMLITLAQALQRARARLSHDSLLAESHAIAVDQKRLRRSVGDIVFTRLGGSPNGEESTIDENPQRAKSIADLLQRADSATNASTDPIDFAGGEAPVVAVNKPLLEAYNAMWDAAASLELAELDRALPHMLAALAAIQRARQAERLYLRGAPPPVVVDVAKVRLTGKDKGSSSARRPLTASDSASRARADRFARVVMLAGRDPRAAADSLLVLRIDALADAPAFAAALGDAVQAMRGGKGDAATAALARARRALVGSPIARDSLGRWGFLP